jgi:hypothetical protein
MYRCRECKRRFSSRWTAARHQSGIKPGEHRREALDRRRTKTRRELAAYGLAALAFFAFLYFITRERSGI